MSADQIIALAAIVAGVGGTLLGIYVGWRLSRSTALKVAREEREWQESRVYRQREDIAAEALREAVIEAQKTLPQGVAKCEDVTEGIFEGSQHLREGWTRASLLHSESIALTFKALDMTLFIAQQSTPHAPEKTINYWPIGVALVEMREVLYAHLRGEDAPASSYPRSHELVRIAGSDRNGIERIRLHLVEHDIGF